MAPDFDDTSATYKRRKHAHDMQRDGRCTLCPPHAGENAKHWKRRANNKAKRRSRK